MKQELLLAILALFLISCESTEEPESLLLPTNMSMTLVQGSNTSRIIADFHYLSEAACLDHITWSNHQTHYFEYDKLMQIRVLREMKVDAKVQEEKWFVYDGALVERVHLVLRNLHYTTLEPLDSIYTGYVEFDYEGEHVVEEREYEILADGHREEFIRKVTYEYYFSGESFVNNIISRTEEESGEEYSYLLSLNEQEYPETINEKLGATYTRITKYAYKSF
jgi:hypothetical protein